MESDADPSPLAAEAATAPPGTGAKPASTMPDRRTAILRTGLVVGVLFVVFGLILPQFVDYEEVFEALLALTLPQILLMTALGIVAWFACGQLFTVLVPGLSPLRGMTAYLILSGMGASLPVRAVEHGRRLGGHPRLGVLGRDGDLGRRPLRDHQHAGPVRDAARRASRSSRSPAS